MNKLTLKYISVFVLLLSISLFCPSCKKLLTFTITNNSNFTISSTSPVNLPFVINTPDVATNSSQEFENNKTHASLVKDIKLSSLKLSITNPSSQKFDFLKSVRIYISTSGVSEIELATLDNISSLAGTIELIPTQAKLDEFVKASKYQLRTEVVTRQVLTQNVDVQIECKFKVRANL